MMKVIDLFAGCGGFSAGFLQAGFEIVAAVEYDKMIAQTYKNNHKETTLIVDDIKNIGNSNIFHEGMADIIIGGPPCQGFSMAGARIRDGFIDDPRNYLFKHYFNIVSKVRPKIFIMENVKGITTMQNGKIFNEIIALFQDLKLLDGHKYNLHYEILKSSDFGIPQKRERMILLGILDNQIDIKKISNIVKGKIKKNYLDFFAKTSVWDAISDLDEIIPTSDGKILRTTPGSNYQKYLSSDAEHIYNHTATKHSKIAIERMKKIGINENFTKLDEDIKSVHSGSYGRLSKDGLSATITTRFDTPSGGKFTHPTQNRTLTPREAARIQSFSDNFIFYGTKSSICKQIGNAVPPKSSFFLAQMVKEILRENIQG